MDISNIHDRFVLITGNRTISFLFKEGAAQPFAVVKSGNPIELGREYENHKRAFNLFPEWVPQIYYYKNEGETASLCVEYVQERFMSNVIAASWFNKKRSFIKEAQSLLSLLVEMMRKYIYEYKIKDDTGQQYECNDILDIIDTYFHSKAVLSNLRKCFDKMTEVRIPFIMQHGDFCVRNILYASRNRKVVIDWEDSRNDHLPLLDFNMLLISLNGLYSRLFQHKNDSFFREKSIQFTVYVTQKRLMDILGLEDINFRLISIGSTAYLCANNLKKKRNQTATEIFNYLKLQTNGLETSGTNYT